MAVQMHGMAHAITSRPSTLSLVGWTRNFNR
jgi:hypothetical protein